MDDLVERLEQDEYTLNIEQVRKSWDELRRERRFAAAEIRSLREQVAKEQAYPVGTRVRKVSGPEWEGVVVGHYSSTYTPDGLVIECTAPGAKGQVHVEPAKRVERQQDKEPT